MAIPRHRRDVVPVTASAQWRGGSRRSTQYFSGYRLHLTHWLNSTQARLEREAKRREREKLEKMRAELQVQEAKEQMKVSLGAEHELQFDLVALTAAAVRRR